MALAMSRPKESEHVGGSPGRARVPLASVQILLLHPFLQQDGIYLIISPCKLLNARWDVGGVIRRVCRSVCFK